MSPFDLGPPPPSRRPSLTPMIDVVFLLLVFFMLAARFGQDMALETTLTG
ncbi:MAG: biopolymer transporter ExbD, partial [Pseudomonadota bacterium]